MKYVVIGASAAGINAAALLRELDPDSSITLVSRDREIYSRCMLHLKLAGKRDDATLSFVDADFFARNGIKWLAGENVVDVLVDGRSVKLESGAELFFDRLLIATGASASVPPVPNLRGPENVLCLRNLEDVRGMAAWGRPGSRAVIVGGGLVGLDAAVGLMELGVKVTVVEMADRILAIQLDRYAAQKYSELLEKHGAEVIVGAKVNRAVLDDAGRVRAVELGDGRELPCDFCVVAAGVAPNIGFIRDERIELTENRRAVKVDRCCCTSVEGIYAAGDVTFIAPIWPEAVRQAEVAATNMAGYDAELPERNWAFTNSMNFFGLPTVSYGATTAADSSFVEDTYVAGDVYRKVVHRNGVVFGAVFQGDIDNCGVYLKLARDRVPFTDTGKDPLRLNYADFFEMSENGQFV